MKAFKIVWKFFKKLLLIIVIFSITLLIATLSWLYFQNNFTIEARMRKKFYKKIEQAILQSQDSFLLKDANLDFGDDFQWDIVCYVSDEYKLAASPIDKKVLNFLNTTSDKLYDHFLYESDTNSYTGMVFGNGKVLKSFNARASFVKNNSLYQYGCCNNDVIITNLVKSNKDSTPSWSFVCDKNINLNKN